MCSAPTHVRFTPNSDGKSDIDFDYSIIGTGEEVCLHSLSSWQIIRATVTLNR
jgi:hypothetical protein